jgi:uncharacterized repeat protein (TIGR01451 family)
VRQIGARNYAGPNCPGKGWNCTTATRVLQIASPGGSNSFVCSPSFGTPTPTNCVIKQIGGSTNTARCTQQSSNADVAQTCDITQSGAANYAYVNQNINQSDGSGQLGKQTATVTQGPASVKNYVQVSQAVNQTSKVTNAGTQNQNADQAFNIEQTATGSGTNTAALNQTQLQKEYARGTGQTQDTISRLDDCNPNTVNTPGPTAPNVCAVVLQHSDAGANKNQLRQNVNEDQNSSGVATQTQGSPDGGLDSRVHQDTNTGTSSNSAVLSKNQHQTAAAGSSQSQDDPVSCCGFASQDGGTNNTESIDLSSSLSASGDSDPEQNSHLIGTSHTPQGTCTVTEKASINQDSATNSDTENPCPFLTLETSCNVDGCTPSFPDTTPPGAPESSLSKCVMNLDVLGDPCDAATSGVTGDTIEFDITYTNAGTATGHGVTVTDVVPDVMQYDSCSAPIGATCSYNSTTNTVTFNLGDVGADSSRDMSIQTTVLCITATRQNVAQGQAVEESEPASSNSVDVAMFEGSSCIG